MDEFVQLYTGLTADEQRLVQDYIQALASGDIETCERMLKGARTTVDKEG